MTGKRIRRIVSRVLAVSMVLALCAIGGASAEEVDLSRYNFGGEMPIVKEKITLTAIIPSIGWIPDIVHNQLNEYLEEKTNIHIEWMEVSPDDYSQKMSILIAGNEYPDIVFNRALAKSQYESYGAQGMFVDLTEYIDQHSTYLKPMMEAYPQVANYTTSHDGNTYFVPSYDSVYHMTMPIKYWVNQAWLNNLGLEMPTTTEEFREMLVAFKEQDANGNGDPGDEIPMTGAIRAFEDTTSYLLSSFVPVGGVSFTNEANNNNYTFIRDGKVTFSATQDAFKEGLAYVKGLYDDGLYDPAAFTQNRDQVKPLVDGGDANRVGGTASHHPGNFASQTDVENGRYLEFAVLPPLMGPEGFQSASWNSTQGLDIGGAVTDKCKDPLAAYLWLDYFLSEEIATITKLGWEGVNWEPAQAGDIGFNGEPAKFRLLKAPIHEDNTILGFYGPKNSMILNGTQAVSDGYDYEQVLYQATMEYDPYKVEMYPYASISMTEDEANRLTDLAKTLESYVGESIDRFILGDLSLESDWDQYLKTLDQIGLTEYLGILEKYYADYQQ